MGQWAVTGPSQRAARELERACSARSELASRFEPSRSDLEPRAFFPALDRGRRGRGAAAHVGGQEEERAYLLIMTRGLYDKKI